ncbi:MAG: AAA family ATPase [Candidatus Hydrothermarchaeota archaeon]|nr:AAA family ATPase [Candidatus Hydrothermarchaeota archaeon]
MPVQYKLPVSDWVEFYRWKENPFKVKVSGENNLFVPLEELKMNIIDRARAGDIINITGSTGIGKTEWALQLYRWLREAGWVTAYIDLSGTEMNLDVFLDAVWHQLHPSILMRLFSKATIETVLQHMKKITKKRPTGIIIDEAQNITDRRVTDAIRRINDNCKDVSIILFSIDDLTKNEAFRESIRRRMSLLSMRGMTLDESESLFTKRIRNAGGEGLAPLSRELVEFLWRKSNKVPGLMLHYAEDICIHNARVTQLKTIGPDLASSVLEVPVMPSVELERPRVKVVKEVKVAPEKPLVVPKIPATVQLKRVLEALSPQQQTVLLATTDIGTFMIEELASKLGMDYNVVRTQLNRINKKVGADVFVLVKKVGKNKYWKLADNYRILFSAE